MARTYRKSLSFWPHTVIDRKARDGHGTPDYLRRFHGGMVMSPSSCGIWNDCRPDGGRDRKAQRRTEKRRERQAWKKEATA